MTCAHISVLLLFICRYGLDFYHCIIYAVFWQIKMLLFMMAGNVPATFHTLPIKQRMRGQGMVLIGIP
ncbi:hypothetical protein DWZ56_13800 [Lachnotalea sp. AF33-28]|nr:hypothetical protein DWZ56_13800 [Lachnotalea sp. AF33-28]